MKLDKESNNLFKNGLFDATLTDISIKIMLKYLNEANASGMLQGN